MDYIQLLFSFFNAPLFATFIIALFWKRATPWSGISGLAAGTLGAAAAHYAHTWGWIDLGTDQAAAFWGATVAFIADAVVTVVVSLFTQPKPVEQLTGLVWSETPKRMRSPKREGADLGWYRSPAVLGGGVLAACVALNFVFA
jgi:SSS family solute:Na+ symporter